QDQDLWSDGLGCLTYLHSRNISHREPTFKIPIDALRRSNSPYLLKYCLYRPTASATSMKYAASELKVSTGSCGDQACNNGRACADLRLFVPPPVHASRDECHAYNLTTRNYFAFLMARPLVGTQLSTTLTDLWRRIQLWSPNASSELYEYCRAQGYTDVTGNPRLAVAMLALATEARWQAVWVDAFAHCVGMQSQL
ncbi:uncharacterized protein K489DRAFT_292754, partial [Dissoconium aciculare CBS 342.82]|uniref:DUF8004 domain-containing protein n=1 Tax=Dissoconium aciculare CBS 342.82 TaxID=1314786 RepID=A0A6J3M9Y4_9PEZI